MCFLVARRPSKSTLFPYTTLFRSLLATALPPADAAGLAGLAADLGGGIESAAEASSLGDRKSTRLNSSHTVISYAVFCLKKKKQSKLSNSSANRNNLRTHPKQQKP